MFSAVLTSCEFAVILLMVICILPFHCLLLASFLFRILVLLSCLLLFPPLSLRLYLLRLLYFPLCLLLLLLPLFPQGAVFGYSFLSSYFGSCVLSSFSGSFCAFYVCRCSSPFSFFASSYCYFSFYLSSWSFAFLCASSFFPSCSSCLFFFSSRSFYSFRCSFFFRFLSSRSTTCSCFPSSSFFFFLFGCLVFLFFPGFRCFSGSLVRFVFGVSVVCALVFPFWGFGFSFLCGFFLLSSVRGC